MRFLLAAVVIPPLVVAATALTHPASLSLESAEYWKNLHIWLLVWFPLLGLGPWLVARAVDRVTSRVVAVAAYTYATFYTSLDVLGGISGGAIKDAEAGGLGILFPIAGDFEQIGGIALVLASALAAGVAMQAVRLGAGRAASRCCPARLLHLVARTHLQAVGPGRDAAAGCRLGCIRGADRAPPGRAGLTRWRRSAQTSTMRQRWTSRWYPALSWPRRALGAGHRPPSPCLARWRSRKPAGAPARSRGSRATRSVRCRLAETPSARA